MDKFGSCRAAHAQVEAGDGEGVRFFGDGLVPWPGQREDGRRDEHTNHAQRAAAAMVAQGGDQHAAKAQHTAQRLARGEAVGLAVEKVGEADLHIVVDAVNSYDVPVKIDVNTTATAINNVENDATKAVKFVKNGQLYIQRGEKLYNVLGAMAE